MDLLEQTDKNFMQIIYDKKYNFQEFIKQNNKYMKEEKIGYDLVEDLYTSPANKKGIYLSLKLIEQIVDYIGYEPKSISIEMAREDEEKGQRTDSRQKLLENIYSKYSKSIDNYNKLNKELNKYETYTNINKEKLFHYFLQEGKCLYCGTSLNIDSLSTDCEIDHIIPQSLIKDDSIDNKALVHKEHNQEKAASVVLPVNFRNHSNIEWWNKLLRCRLISHKKFSNLIRSKFRDEDIEGFINRQLVETRQITKHVANILGNIYKNTKIIYLKANLSSNYRNKNQMFKYRDLNDYHHAHDAYLAIALGEYKEKLNTITFDELKERTKRSFEKGIYNKQYGYVLNQIDENIYDEKTGEVIFDSKQFNDTVINTLYQNDIIVNKKTEIRTGEFYNQTKYKKTDKNKGYKIKDNLPVEKYGYYDSIKPSYISLVKYGDKQKLIGIPIIIDLKSKKDNNIKIDYIRNLLKIKKDVEIKILIEKIPFYTLINFDGKICSIVGASDSIEVCNAIEFNIDKSNQIKWKYTLHKLLNNKSLDHVINLSKKYNEKSTYNEDVYEKQIDEIIDYIFKKVDEKYLLYKDSFIKLRKSLNDVYSTIKLEDKEKLIKELLRLLKYNSSTASLKFLGSEFADGYGRKKGQSITHATIYNKSISGLKGNKNEF